MKKTKIYGASDDLIEIDGAIYDEVGDYSEKKIKISASDGTEATIIYGDGDEGNWKIELVNAGDKFITIVPAVGDDNKHVHEDAIGYSPYSDVLILNEGIEWVKIGKKKFKK